MASQLQDRNCADCAVAKRSTPPEPGTIDGRLSRQIEALIPRLTRYARSLTHDLVAADDLVQESLSRALAKLHLWHPGTDLRAWLFTIMHHQYINELRRVARERNVPLGEHDRRVEPDQAMRLEFRDLARAIDALSSEQRSAIMLVAVNEMQYAEAASVLNLALGTVRSRVSRGRDTLRRLTGRRPADIAGNRAEIAADIEEPPAFIQRESGNPSNGSRASAERAPTMAMLKAPCWGNASAGRRIGDARGGGRKGSARRPVKIAR